MGRCYLFGLSLFLGLLRAGRGLQNVTAQLFGAEAFGTLVAFGDFNSDKQTDLFVLRGGNELLIFLADQKEPYFKPKVKLSINQGVITSVVPGDYDGDSQMDVLLTTQPQNHVTNELSVIIFWGRNQTLDYNRKTVLNKTFHDEPLIMDFNGDLIPDVFGVTNESDRPQILIGRHIVVKLQHCPPNIIKQSCAMMSRKHLTKTDLFLTTLSNSQQIQFETWVNKDGNFSKVTDIKQKPEDTMVVGQSVFADFEIHSSPQFGHFHGSNLLFYSDNLVTGQHGEKKGEQSPQSLLIHQVGRGTAQRPSPLVEPTVQVNSSCV
ncbi:T-cell immunomodulatory protein [Chelonia mydas]|uniref:T-cell immunomodulatory protein n=1 Tax=Chelonia mydas TaxID=8469 RepID=M7C5X4_CHEMY|nr:T-cell immunomodulatory protein [Chelonia mydas]